MWPQVWHADCFFITEARVVIGTHGHETERKPGPVMLRIEFHNVMNAVTIQIEDQFVGSFADDVRALIARCKTPSRLVVNVSEVTFVDAIGEEALSWLGRIGAEFVAEGAYALQLCERLHLPLAPEMRQPSPKLMQGRL